MHKISFLSTTIFYNPNLHNPKLKSSQPKIEIIWLINWQSIFALRVCVSIRVYHVTFVIVHCFRVFYLPWLFLLKLCLLKLSHIFQWFSLYWVEMCPKIVIKRNLVSIGILLPLQEGMFDWCINIWVLIGYHWKDLFL